MLSGEVRRVQNTSLISLEMHAGKEVTVLADPQLPIGAKVTRFIKNGRPGPRMPSSTLRDRLTIETDYTGGIDIVPPVASPHPGDQSSALKIIHAGEAGPNTVDIQLAGLGGRTYSLNLVTTVPNLSADGATVSKTDDGYRLEISFDGSGYVTRDIKVRW
jgi:hypothetical protein